MLDPEGRVATWNEGARRIKGYSAEEIVGQHFSKFYLREDVEQGYCERELAEALRFGRFEDYGWRVRKDGSQFWANVVITPLRDARGKHIGFAKVTRDMTDRAYRTFVEATHAIVWTTDATGAPNADSSTWRAFTGQSEAEWRASHSFDMVHPEDRAKAEATWAKARAERKNFRAEFRLRRHDGNYQWVESRAIPFLDGAGNVREWFGVTLDISARKDAEHAREAALAREHEARVESERLHAQLATMLGSIGDAVIATDAAGNVSFMNPVAEKLTRWHAAEARGRPLPEVFPIVNEETRRPVTNPVEKVLREGVIVGLANHTVLVRRDGTDLPIDDSAAPIRDAEGNLFGVVMVFRDVTVEKRESHRRAFLLRAGEALMTSADYRDSLATIAHFAVPRLADWCTIDVAEPGATALTRLATAHVDPAKLMTARELARKYPPDPQGPFGPYHVLRTGVSELYRHVEPTMVARTAQSEEHKKFLEHLGLRSAMVVPLRGRERVLGVITFVYAESGREYTEEDLLFAEEVARRAGVVIERRKLEEERVQLLERERRAREQAEIANRAKDEFLATVSHELRNPLSTILGWSKVLASSELPERLREPVSAIERNARSQQRLIDDMLDVSRIISGKLRLQVAKIDVTQTVTDAIESQQRAADAKGVIIESNVGPGIEAEADQVRLQQVVSNLVANAVKFTPRGGVVTVSVACERQMLVITVADTGEGIDPNRIEAIFEPFRQEDASTTRRHGGLGLGLAIVRELVQAHGGSVRAESPGKGRGATFFVELPAHCESTFVPSVPSSQKKPIPRIDGVRVLVVDDERDVIDLLVAVLEGAGANVLVATTAAQALQMIRRERPDVMTSDIGMPDTDGYELMRRIRALPTNEGGRTPAVAVTAYARPEDLRKAFEAGFQRHVAKPLDPAEIVFIIGNLLGLPLRY
jgi:PAS domain S-box-containing protein